MPWSGTSVGIAIADQLQQLLRHRFMAVSGVAALLRHRALGLAKGALDVWPPGSIAGRAVVAHTRVVIDHGCNPSFGDPVTRCLGTGCTPKGVDLATVRSRLLTAGRSKIFFSD
jgi:hypothetical protein